MKKIFLSLLMGTLVLVACNEDILDKKPLDKLSEESVFESEALMDQYVVALYNVIPGPYTEGTLAAVTDEAWFRYGGTSTRYIVNGAMTPDNVMYIAEGGQAHDTRMTFLNIWRRVFPYIRDMNKFLEKVDDAPIPENIKKQLKGEVLFLRAWAYSNLLQRYAGVPVITKVYELGEEYNQTRDNYDDCVDFIIRDLDAAGDLLDSKHPILGRAGKDVCLALKARTCLYAASPLFNDPKHPEGSIFRGQYDAKKWEKARDAAKALIDIADGGAYRIAPTYDDYWRNPNCTEVIWAKYYNQMTGNSEGSAQVYYAPGYPDGGWLSCTPVDNLVWDYEMAATGKKPFEAGSGYDANVEPYKTNPWANRDPRFYKSILYPQQVYKGDTITMCYPAAGNTVIRENDPNWYVSGTGGTGYWLHKWILDDAEFADGGPDPTVMYPWFRLAEIYLIYAEASLECGDPRTCGVYINKIRARADVNMPPVDESLGKEAMKEKLIQERRIEFAFENQRYFDLRRWKLAEIYENLPTYGISAARHDDNSITWEIAHLENGKVIYNQNRDMFGGSMGGRNFYLEHYLMPVPRNEWQKAQGSLVQNPYYDDAPQTYKTEP
ncbi:MAG: RagB/SusD family nutrient uptake outer membrane protein [Tannerellaceae bacterium]|jgi:hypothetical protein|nr:RagB/SusD family nutrient uptake outer membrane protein [Tannerellaceae bacterium]